MVYATYAGKADGVSLRESYYAHRRVEFPPDHGESAKTCAGAVLLTKVCTERVAGKDYSQGWKTYAFAAPFSDRDLNLSPGVKSAAVH